jgi:hypothetical protein
MIPTTRTVLAVLATGLAVLTLCRREWIEAVTGLDPDAHSGTAEWLIVAGLLLVAATSAVLARREYRRSTARSAPPVSRPRRPGRRRARRAW